MSEEERLMQDQGSLRGTLDAASRALRFALLAGCALVADFILLTYFNTLIWPYFWPTSAFVVMTICFAVMIWFPEFGQSIWMLRIVGLLLIFIGQSYLIHSFLIAVDHASVLAWLHVFAVFGMFVVLVLNYINQMNPKNNTVPPRLPRDLPYIAAVVPTYGEPNDVLEKTVASLTKLDYPRSLLCIVISDDGRRGEIRQLAQKYGVEYNPGPQKNAKAGNLNSALRFLDSVCPQASLILTQDADEVVHPEFLIHTIGYFNDPGIAFVQTPKEVVAPKTDPFGTRDRMFYDIFQVGRNGAGAAFACGSGVLWRIDAVKSIGGFATWNVVEDLTTSYQLHSKGWRSEYHNEKLSVGLAPEDIPGLLKQRGTWAVDTWRLFLFDNPLFKHGLTAAQRLQYLELGLFYVMSAFFMPLLMFIPIVALATGDFIPINGSALFPWIAINILYYVTLSRGRSLYMLRMWQYWIGLWPTYLKAFWIAIRSRDKKPKYIVTRKTRDRGFYAHLLSVQFAYIFIGVAVSIYSLVAMPHEDLGTRLANIGIVLFFIFMIGAICRAAFYGVEPMLPRWLVRLLAPGHGQEQSYLRNR
jgi:cellulose synthase (UDP-forming)